MATARLRERLAALEKHLDRQARLKKPAVTILEVWGWRKPGNEPELLDVFRLKNGAWTQVKIPRTGIPDHHKIGEDYDKQDD